jgi:hypothetical protein
MSLDSTATATQHGVVAASGSTTAATNNNNKINSPNARMQRASQLCGQGRLAWQNNDYTTALENFGVALRLLQTSLSPNHPLVAKTHYWIGFIYKHLPRGTRVGRHDVVIRFLLLSLEEFTHSARIRLFCSSAAAATPSSSTATASTPTSPSGEQMTMSSKDKESLQAIEWVLKAIQDQTHRRGAAEAPGGRKDDGDDECPYSHVQSVIEEIIHQRSRSKNDQGRDSTWESLRSLQSLILARPLTSSPKLTAAADDDDDDGLISYPYIAALRKSVEEEATADFALRKGDYGAALQGYVKAQHVFPRPNGSLWGKRAFCHHQLGSSTKKSSTSSTTSSNAAASLGNMTNDDDDGKSQKAKLEHLQLALRGYRRALKIFASTSTMVLTVNENIDVGTINSTQGNRTLRLDDHPDIRTTIDRWGQVYKQYVEEQQGQMQHTVDDDEIGAVTNDVLQTNHDEVSELLRVSVKQEQEADAALGDLLWYHDQLDDVQNITVGGILLKRRLRSSLLNGATWRYEEAFEWETKVSKILATYSHDHGVPMMSPAFNGKVLDDLKQSLLEVRAIIPVVETINHFASNAKAVSLEEEQRSEGNGVVRDDGLDETVAQMDDAEHANSYTKELETWKSRYENLESEFAAMKKQLVALQQENEKSTPPPKSPIQVRDGESSSPQNLHQQVRAEKERLAARLRRKHETKMKEVGESCPPSPSKTSYDSLHSQTDELKNEIKKLQTECRDLQSTITTLTDVKGKSDRMVHTLQDKVLKLQNENEAEMLQLSTKLKKSIQRVHELEISNFKLQEQISIKDKLLDEQHALIEKQREKVNVVARQQEDKEKHTNLQNERAAKMIQELSAELQKMNDVRNKQEQRLAKLHDLVLAMEARNRIAKQQKGSAKTPYRTTEKVKRLTAKILALQEESGIEQDELQGKSSRDLRDDVRRDLFGANTNSPYRNTLPVMEPMPWRLALYVFIKKVISTGMARKTTFETDLAVYSIRVAGEKDCSIFENAVNNGLLKTADNYASSFKINRPSSIDIVARLRHDGSHLVLSGDHSVLCKRSTGEVLIKNSKNGSSDCYESMDTLLGWVDDRISLDQVYEESYYFREEYSKIHTMASIPVMFPPSLHLIPGVVAFLVAMVGSFIVLVLNDF